MEALDNACYDLWRPLTNLTQTFRACHLRTFNVGAIFFGAIPTYGVLPYAMIFVLRLKRQHEIPRVVAEILHPFELFQNTNGSSRAFIYHHQPSKDLNEF